MPTSGLTRPSCVLEDGEARVAFEHSTTRRWVGDEIPLRHEMRLPHVTWVIRRSHPLLMAITLYTGIPIQGIHQAILCPRRWQGQGGLRAQHNERLRSEDPVPDNWRDLCL
ncbi:hypothetical protein F2P79_024302 [Pimephales promelas]|nr:hypothetical protein F2P79_024302 [Pimephales promelas]